MKNTYISIIVLVIVLAGGWFLVSGNKKAEAPEVATGTNDTGAVQNTMPVIGEEGKGITEVVVVKEFTVSGKNFSFEPSTIKVQKGDKVKIIFKNSQGFHDWVIDEYGVATKQTQAPAEEVLEFVADKAGSFEYYCSVGSHRAMGMKGTLIVE